MRADYCPMANEPCQGMCDVPCSDHRLKPADESDMAIYKAIAENYTAPQAQQPDTSCKFPLCQTEQYQQMLEKQVARDLFGSEQPAVVPLTTEEYTDLAHRIASKYAHSSDPRHIAYTFLPHTLEQFTRAIEQAVLKKNGVAK